MLRELPKHVSNLYELPTAEGRLYKYYEAGFYQLTNGGQSLNFVRKSLQTERQIGEGKARTFYAKVALADWTATMSAATSPERRELLRLAAAGRIKIEKETPA